MTEPHPSGPTTPRADVTATTVPMRMISANAGSLTREVPDSRVEFESPKARSLDEPVEHRTRAHRATTKTDVEITQSKVALGLVESGPEPPATTGSGLTGAQVDDHQRALDQREIPTANRHAAGQSGQQQVAAANDEAWPPEHGDREAYESLRRVFGETPRNWKLTIDKSKTASAGAVDATSPATKSGNTSVENEVGRLEKMLAAETSNRYVAQHSMEHEVRRQVQALRGEFEKRIHETERRFREFFSR